MPQQQRPLQAEREPLDEARFITLRGVPVSLREIREKIVFRHWKDPKVIYGFWRGEIGGPSLQREAFNAENVGRLLVRGAADFVNSLRGTQELGGRLQVSELYKEATPFFFPDFERDLRAHLALPNVELRAHFGDTPGLRGGEVPRFPDVRAQVVELEPDVLQVVVELDEFVVTGADGRVRHGAAELVVLVVGVVPEERSAAGHGAAAEVAGETHAVDGGARRRGGQAGEFHQRGEEIHRDHGRVGHPAALDHARPIDDERHADAALVGRRFA